MKKLYLVRHAKSSWSDLDMNDFDRPLNSRGEEDAPHMAKLLKKKGIMPDRMITSPATRALSTCQIFARTLHFDTNNIITDRKLYHASADAILKILDSLAEHKVDRENIFLFGHNPGITEFANALLGIGIDNIPTCGIVEATLSIDSWAVISFGCGKLDAFTYPKGFR